MVFGRYFIPVEGGYMPLYRYDACGIARASETTLVMFDPCTPDVRRQEIAMRYHREHNPVFYFDYPGTNCNLNGGFGMFFRVKNEYKKYYRAVVRYIKQSTCAQENDVPMNIVAEGRGVWGVPSFFGVAEGKRWVKIKSVALLNMPPLNFEEYIQSCAIVPKKTISELFRVPKQHAFDQNELELDDILFAVHKTMDLEYIRSQFTKQSSKNFSPIKLHTSATLSEFLRRLTSTDPTSGAPNRRVFIHIDVTDASMYYYPLLLDTMRQHRRDTLFYVTRDRIDTYRDIYMHWKNNENAFPRPLYMGNSRISVAPYTILDHSKPVVLFHQATNVRVVNTSFLNPSTPLQTSRDIVSSLASGLVHSSTIRVTPCIHYSFSIHGNIYMHLTRETTGTQDHIFMTCIVLPGAHPRLLSRISTVFHDVPVAFPPDSLQTECIIPCIVHTIYPEDKFVCFFTTHPMNTPSLVSKSTQDLQKIHKTGIITHMKWEVDAS